jgi:osmotically-inducible protein OsmY
MSTRLMTITAIAAVAATMGLAGCDRGSRDSARNTADETVAQVDQKARQIGNEMKSGTQRMGDKMDDAAITASVKTEIAKEHATALAQGVKGVTGVDNQLSVAPKP